MKKEDQILMAGCGTSKLTEHMYDDGLLIYVYTLMFNKNYFHLGYTKITNIDVSRVAIDIMQDRYKEKTTLQWQPMNLFNLDFPDETFDVVIAKGTVDAILCGEGSSTNMVKLCNQVSRVLKPKGHFIVVSYGVPDNRMLYLDKEDSYSWTVTVQTVPKPIVSAASATTEEANGVHYIYICSKGGASVPATGF